MASTTDGVAMDTGRITIERCGPGAKRLRVTVAGRTAAVDTDYSETHATTVGMRRAVTRGLRALANATIGHDPIRVTVTDPSGMLGVGTGPRAYDLRRSESGGYTSEAV